MRLVLVELARLRSRRAVVLLVLLAALLGAMLAGTAAWDTRPVPDRAVERAQVQAAALAGDPKVQEDLSDCESNPEDYFGPDADPAVCERFLLPRTEDFLPRQPLDLDAVLEGRGLALTTLVTALLIIAAATFAGADWSTGSIGNQLLFRPRRGRVWLAKAAAVLLGALGAATVVLGGFWVFLTLVAESRGIATSPDLLASIRWTTARGVAAGRRRRRRRLRAEHAAAEHGRHAGRAVRRHGGRRRPGRMRCRFTWPPAGACRTTSSPGWRAGPRCSTPTSSADVASARARAPTSSVRVTRRRTWECCCGLAIVVSLLAFRRRDVV